MVRSLMHKLIVEDSTDCFTAMPDYLLVFKKKGENKVPVEHPTGLSQYAGETPVLDHMLRAYNNANKSNFTKEELWSHLNETFYDHDDPSNKLSHYIWQRYASSVWDDIRINNVLPFKDSRDDDDEKHVHPLQLDVIARVVELYSNRDEVVFTPFMGVGSEVFTSINMGRKGVGVELKKSYYNQAEINVETEYDLFSAVDQKQPEKDDKQMSLLS